MGFWHEDTGPLVGIESRGESFRLFNLANTEHIFAFEDGNVEITYEFLAAFLARLQEPEVRKALLKGHLAHRTPVEREPDGWALVCAGDIREITTDITASSLWEVAIRDRGYSQRVVPVYLGTPPVGEGEKDV